MTSVHPYMAWFSGAGGVRLKAEGQYGEVAYGIAGFQGTPHSGFYLGESALGAPQHTVGVRGRLRFR